MQGTSLRLWMTAFLTLSATVALHAADNTPQTKTNSGKETRPCSLSGINSDCTLEIDRQLEKVPNSIRMNHGARLTIHIKNGNAFEEITLKHVSGTLTPPVDTYASGYQALISQLGGMTLAPMAIQNYVNKSAKLITSCDVTRLQRMEDQPSKPEELEQSISTCQKIIEQDLPANNVKDWLLERLAELKAVNQSAVWTLSEDPAPKQDPNPVTPAAAYSSLLQVKTEDFDTKYPAISEELSDQIEALNVVLANVKKKLKPGDYQKLQDAQAGLQAKADNYTSMLRIGHMITNFMEQLAKPESVSSGYLHIAGGSKKEWADDTEVWRIQATSRLAPLCVKLKADQKTSDVEQAVATLLDATTPQDSFDLKIVYTRVPLVEISSGVAVPVHSYHSYSLAFPLSAANMPSNSCPGTPSACSIVVDKPTQSFVPAVYMSHEFWRVSPRGHRVGFLLAATAGYNSANTTAIYGIGPALSFGSAVINLSAIRTTDQVLAGKYELNKPAGTATTPMTTTQGLWSFAPGISLRIPLGGGAN